MPHAAHTQAAEAPELAVFDLRIRVLLDGAVTGGGLALCEERTPGHSGPPLHAHDDADEFFRVLEGRYRFRVEDRTIEAGPGHALFVPRGAPHCFVNALDTPGRLLFGLTPAGCERFFAEVAARALDPARDMPAIVALGGLHGLRFLGPNPLRH